MDIKNKDFILIDFKNGKYEAYFERSEVAKRLNVSYKTILRQLKSNFYECERYIITYLDHIQVKSRRGNPNF